MKTWMQLSDSYIEYLTEKGVAKPNIRLVALKKIEQFISELYPGILNDNINFSYLDKAEFRNGYERWKGKNINGAEKQVFNDFYTASNLNE